MKRIANPELQKKRPSVLQKPIYNAEASLKHPQKWKILSVPPVTTFSSSYFHGLGLTDSPGTTQFFADL